MRTIQAIRHPSRTILGGAGGTAVRTTIAALTLLFAFAATAFAQGASQASAGQQTSSKQTRTSLFQIVILMGEKAPGKSSDDVPQNVEKALSDISEFLPYKSYRMIDTALVRSEYESVGRMAGPTGTGHLYEFILEHRRNPSDNSIHVRGFSLADMARSPKRRLLSTSFSVKEQETIVVGTSKINGGDQALIVLFTAVQ